MLERGVHRDPAIPHRRDHRLAASIEESDEELKAFLTKAGLASEVLILREGRVAAHAPTAALRAQVNAASLEDAFRALVFTTDVDAVAGEIVAAIAR